MEFQDRVSAYPNRYILTTQDGTASYILLERADEPIIPGTPLNAETFNTLFGGITLDSIGAAAANHTHTAASIGAAKNTGTGRAYLPPTEADIEACVAVIAYDEKFDVNGDGFVDAIDVNLMRKAHNGLIDVSSFKNAKQTSVTVKINPSNPHEVISIEGKTMWGGDFKAALGFDTIAKLNELESRIAVLEGK